MMNVVKVLICIIIVALASLLQNVINIKKNRRARQALLPFIAVFYGIVATFVGYNYFDSIAALVKDNPFLVNFDVAVINCALLIGFVVIKLVLRPIVTNIWKKKDLIETTSVAFYSYDDEYDEWFLLRKWVNFRKFVFAIVCGATLAIGTYLGIIWACGIKSPVWNLVFPSAALIVINEMYNFINGQTKEEFEHSVLGEDADARRTSNFYKIREVLEEILPEPLLASHTGFEFAEKQTPADLIKELKGSDNRVDIITGEYFAVNERYTKADIDCVQATLHLMHRNNVIFFNPFYRDMSMYITLPLVNCLLSGKKCVVITGRMSNCHDVKDWLTDMLGKYSHMKSLWRVQLLSEKEPKCEVGILSFSQLYDNKIMAANQKFFAETDFSVLIEPSIIVNTGQIALSIIAQQMHCNDELPVYCVCDRNTDGLVDTLSHLLHAEFTNVVAPPVPRSIYTGMSWDADGDFIRQQLFDKQTKYLGNGVELAAIAVKNQIPSVSWYCETKAPIRDIQWIAGQYHSSICRYMNLPTQQKILYEKIKFISNLWSTPTQREQFIIAEDEFCNMFSTMRAYLSRGTTQSFVNVFSENYLLRDYMRCNKQMFMSNPNAIPSIVPDYAKTERNTLIKLLLLMTYRSVTDAEIIDEFHLVGVDTNDALEILTKMLKKYTFADNSIFTVQSVRTEVDELTTISTCCYTISNEVFDEFFADSLKNAYFILEDEKHESGYIDAKLFGHVTQIILPGQFVTYDGKYYMAKHVSPQSGVVLRRASDLYDGRKYYRQIREYVLDESPETIVSSRTVMDIEIAFVQRDFSVNTTGYLEMRDNHDLRTARTIDFADDPTTEKYARKYHNKSILRIKLPDTNDKIRFTICLLLSEVFKSVFPDGWPYLAVVAKRPEDVDGILNYLVYPIEGDVVADYIYIIEDSEIDLGLLEAVDRNLTRLMEIVTDFLEWHYEKMREPASKDPVPVSINYSEKKEIQKKHNYFVRMAQWVSKLFGKKKEEVVKIEDKGNTGSTAAEDESNNDKSKTEEISTGDFTLDDSEQDASKPVVIDTEHGSNPEHMDYSLADDENSSEETVADTSADEDKHVKASASKFDFEEDEFLPSEEEDPEIVHVDGTDIFDNEGLPEDDFYLEREFERIGITPLTKSRYQNECFLKFGFEEIDGRLQIEEVRKYLHVRGWSNNSLAKARKRNILVKKNLDVETVNHCDFCSLPLGGVSYEVLNDGRIRCNDCSSNAISSVEDLRKLFGQVLEMMEAFYGVKYSVPIHVAMADARAVAKGAGCVFQPSTKMANRVLGFAQHENGKYSLLIENGSPRLASIDTMVHEMTHIWQYLNWNDNEVSNVYSMGEASCTGVARDIVYEGMAKWASIQYLYQIGETYYAAQQEALAEARTDVYGIGYRLYAEQYPIVKDSSLIKYSPFTSFPTLEPDKAREKVRKQCTKEKCVC